MGRYRVVLIVVLLLVVAGVAYAQTTWTRVSSFKFDWDGHKRVQDGHEIPYPWNDPGDFTLVSHPRTGAEGDDDGAAEAVG